MNTKQNVIIRRAVLLKKTALSNATIHNKMNPRSKYYDETFPKRVRLGAKAVGWYELEVDNWILNREKVSG